MNIRKYLIIWLTMLMGTVNFQFSTFNFQLGIVRAQDITVTVTPTQQVLPPQVMLYITEPANYFNITLSNTGKDNESVYLVMQVEQTNPSTGLGLSTPPKRQPQMPIVVPAGGTRILTPAEIRGLFNHIPLNEIKAPADLFNNYMDGSFGLLPEGQYEVHLTAYHWNPTGEPYVVSMPTGGVAYFSICYKAQAPEFLTPMSIGASAFDLFSVAELDLMNPQFTWKAPVVSCNPTAIQYTYSFRIVELLPGQMPDNSMDSNPVVYQVSNLVSPMCMIPYSVTKQLKSGKTYAAQVTATPANSNNKMLNYVSIENKGKSTYKLFRIKGGETHEEEPKVIIPEPQSEETEAEEKGKDEDKIAEIEQPEEQKDEEEDEDEEEEDDISVTMGDVKTNEIIEDSLYTFRNPKIVDPFFRESEGARKRFVETGIEVAWESSQFVGGEGQQNDTIQIEYEVQLFDNGERADREDAVQQEPIYTFRTKEQKDTIEWKDISEKVEAGDYMVLRIKPIVTKGSSVAFTGDDNVVDFALVNRLSKQYFQCSSTVEIENTKPTSKSASDLKGKQVSIGEYVMTIDEISGSGDSGFKGKGRVLWEPFGSKIMVCVTFDKLKINIDDVVYEGVATSETAPTMGSNKECVDKLFSDWGIDNLISDTGIPYASQLQSATTSGVKSLAEQVNLSKYYQAIKDSEGLYNLLTTGGMDKLYTPIKFPTEILPSNWDVVDIQIADMKFAPDHATMNIVGQSILPECDVLKSKILLFGAPRICISPNRFLPESGQIALLGDFTLAPNSDIEITFKAPNDVLEPKDGCYVSWKTEDEKTKLELLGIDAYMKVAGIVKDDNGKPTTERPNIHLQASFGSWKDFLVDDISIEDFQVEDLPGWTFTAKDIVYDHSDSRNSAHMGKFPEKYSKTKAGIKGNEESWHGLHIGEIGIKFPKSLEIGVGSGDEDKRLSIKGEEMYFDKSGVTLKMTAENIFSAKEGTMGGWGISLDKAQLQIIQDDFDNCMFAGQLNVPLFGSKEKKKDSSGKEKFGNIDYTCEIRRLTDPRKRSAVTEAIDPTSLQKTRYSYVFLTESVEDLNFNCFVAQATLDAKQTYFLIEAYDDEKEDKINTQVELCIGGTIGIGSVDKANAWLKEKTSKLPLEVKIPDIHFTKMRLSNVKRNDWKSVSTLAANKRKDREAREQQVEQELRKSAVYHRIAESEEMELGEGFYLDLGEWSLASAKKRLGPFSFSLDKFSPSFKDKALTVAVSGTIGLVEDKINVGAGIIISAKLDMPGKDISKWSISDGEIKFDSLALDLDFTALHLKGGLKIIEDGTKKGYRGDLDIDITGLFSLKCNGGYFEHAPDDTSEAGMKDDGVDTKTLDDGDKKYSWGYFMVKMESSTGIRIDPIVINRISGGFFFNCRPTKGKDSKTDKFSGTPEASYGNIGVALGMTLSTSAGEKTLKADMDLLVCYDRKNKCLSTFMFNGHLEAVGGLINADASLIYENQKSGSTTKNRYLCLNVTMEAGADTKALIASVEKANAALAALKDKMEEFQANVDDIANKMVVNPMQGMKQLSGKYNGDQSTEVADGDTEDKNVKAKSGENKEDLGITAMRTKISLEFKITWVKDGVKYNTPKWHLYLGEPEKDKRCSFTYLKFDGKIVHVDIGADGYLCLGNELPNNGALPAIPSKIVEFLSGHKSGSTDMGADLSKAERSRKRAAQAMLGDNINGGVMVGASAWGYINIDLGLLYGSLDAIAGFDCSLINYGDAAFCVNNNSTMGKNGWYAMGQLYAYLAAELGIHVKIGSFINEKISIFDAGIGGVLEVGLPNPSWVEGQARIKLSLLGGLCKINKKFEFSAGDHCVPFKGNALDGFEMFQGVSIGSDSIYQALIDPTYAVSLNEAKNMTFTTTSSIGSHYRLVDPSWVDELAARDESDEEDVKERIAKNASRTYVFDVDTKNTVYHGVRLFDLGTKPTILATGKTRPTEKEFYKSLGQKSAHATKYDSIPQFFVSRFSNRERTVEELSCIMTNKQVDKGEADKPLNGSWTDYLDTYLSSMHDRFHSLTGHGVSNMSGKEKKVTAREDKGTVFHVNSTDLQPGHSYAMVLTADAYEIENGKRVWCTYVDSEGKAGKKNAKYDIHWKQSKIWFFRIKGTDEEKIVTDSLRNLEPYIALAYPSTNGTKVVEKGTTVTKAYYDDIMYPTIALTRDLRTVLPASKMKWHLSFVTEAGDTTTVEKPAVYKINGNCYNLQPDGRFSTGDNVFFYSRNSTINAGRDWDFNKELYHLELRYTYQNTKGRYYDPEKRKHVTPDSTFNLVDLWLTSLPHNVNVDNQTYTDSWNLTTTKEVKEVLPYSYPFVGARMESSPTIDYEVDYNNTYKDKNKKEIHSLTDENHIFLNSKWIDNKKGINTPYRLIDPYMYFAYLGKWVFIGDREISPYSFDEVGVKFAAETLVFDHNGTVVNPEFLKDVKDNKSLAEMRKQMYDVWNTGYHTDSETYVQYPLPGTGKTVGGLTAGNQDGKTSTVTPLNVNYDKDYTFCFQDLVKSYTDVYDVAGDLSDKLKEETQILCRYFFDTYGAYKVLTNDKLKANTVKKDHVTSMNANYGTYYDFTPNKYTVSDLTVNLPDPESSSDMKGLFIKLKTLKTDNTKKIKINIKSRFSNTAFNYWDGTNWIRWEDGFNLAWESDKTYELKFIWNSSTWSWDVYGKNHFDEPLDWKVKDYTQRHRGQYLEVSKGDYNVKIPYYQLPLIYGDCFAEAKYNGWGVNKLNRSFKNSIGKDDMKSSGGDDLGLKLDARYASHVSNLFFFRLNNYASGGNYKTDIPYEIYNRKDGVHNNSYKNSTSNSRNVEWDQFRKDLGLKAVSGFNALIYRVDAYDTNTGLYTVKEVRGLSEKKTVNIGVGNKTATNLGEMNDAITAKDKYLRTHYDQPQPQALWVENNKTLYFVYSDSIYTEWRDKMDGQQITNIFSGKEAFENTLWRKTLRGTCEKVKFDSSFKNADIRTTKEWFWGMQKLKEVVDAYNLNTKYVTDMSYMFYNCSELTSLNLSGWNTSKVKNLKQMFYGCKKLTSVNLGQWDTSKVEDMSGMFYQCSALTNTYDISGFTKFNTAKVKTMQSMFRDCTSLTECHMSNFTCENLTSVNSMFSGCKNLKSVDLRTLEGKNLTQTADMFNGCKSLKVLYLQSLIGKDEPSPNGDYKGMFTGVSGYWMVCSINYGLIDKIKDQIPGSPVASYDNNYKAVYGYISGISVKHVLIFTRSTEDYKKNKSYIFTLNGVSKTVTVKDVWSGEAVLGKSYPTDDIPWAAGRNWVTEVYIQPSFAQSPSSTKNWFYNFKELTDIYGLENLNTSRVTTMAAMFEGCAKLKKLDLSHFSTAKLTKMERMFYGCSALEKLSFGYNWQTENVTTMSSLFNGCSSLKELAFTYSFDTKNVTTMAYMFNGCSSLENFDLNFQQTFNTENVTDMAQMFFGCSRLKRMLPITSTENVTNMSHMFYACQSMEEINFTGYDLSKVTDMRSIFGYCQNLKSLNLSTFMGEKLTNYSSMFNKMNSQCYIYIPYNCKKAVLDQCPKSSFPNLVLIYPAYVIRYQVGGNSELLFLGSKTTLKKGDKYMGYTILDVWSGSDVIANGSSQWTYDSRNPIVKVTIHDSFKDVPIVNARSFFNFYAKKCTDITGLEYLNVANAKNFSNMFNGYRGTWINLSGWDTSNATDMSYMFANCPELKTLTIGSIKTDKVTDMTSMFSGCKSLEKIFLSGFNTSNVTSMAYMFNACRSLKSLDVSKFDTQNLKSNGGIIGMFESCESLKSIDLSKFDLSRQENMAWMFSGCSSLESLDLSSVDLSKIEYMYDAFGGCTSLRKLTIGSMISPYRIQKTEFFNEDKGAFNEVHDVVVVTPPDMLESIKDAFVNTQHFVEGVTGTFYDKEPSKKAQAIWTADNSTLTFLYNYPVGDYFNGQVVTQKWDYDDMLTNGKPEWTMTVRNKMTTAVFDPSFANTRPTNVQKWFDGCSELTEIQGLKYLNTSQATSMARMFWGCSKLTEIDLSNFNTAKVTEMNAMFYNCANLTSLDLSKFNTAKVTTMSSMFYNCSKLTSLDLSTFNTSSVTNADRMFSQMSKLKVLRLGQNFTFPSMGSMAASCFKYDTKMIVEVHSNYMTNVKADVINKLGFIENANGENGEFVEYDKKVAQAIWTADNSTLTFFYGKQYKNGDTFRNGKTVTNVWSGTDLTSTTDSYGTRAWQSTVKDKLTTVEFDQTFAEIHLTTGSGLFKNCSKLKSVKNIQYLNTDKMGSMYSMFNGCSSLASLDVSHFNTSSVAGMTYMFNGCSSLKSLDVSNWNTAKVTSMQNMFYECSSLTTLATGKWDTGKVTIMSSMFYGCSKLESLDVSGWNTGNVTTMASMFSGCSSLKNIDVSKWNTIKVTSMACMFSNCSSLTSLPNNFDTGQVTSMGYMFNNCKSLKGMPYINWDVSKVTNFSFMFYGCLAMTDIDLDKWTTTAATDMSSMFKNCTAAKYIRVKNFNTSKVTNMSYMFYGTKKLEWLQLSFNASNVTNMSYMFAYCGSESTSFNIYGDFITNTSKVTNMSYMFYACSKWKQLDLRDWNITNVTNCKMMFAYCSALKEIYVGEKFYNTEFNDAKAFDGLSGLTIGLYKVPEGTSRNNVTSTLKRMNFVRKVTGQVYPAYLGPWGLGVTSSAIIF